MLNPASEGPTPVPNAEGGISHRPRADQYDASYYAHYYSGGDRVAYERNEQWLGFFGAVATRIETGGLVIDVATWTCTVDGTPIGLPRRLFTLLHALASQPGRVLRKEQLVYQVWGINSDIYNRAVDNAVVELRRLLGDSSSQPRFVHTVRGVGYKFEVAP